MLGTRHCFNSIADSRHNLLSLKPMHEVVALDARAGTVTVDAGITYGQLCPYLDSKGFALHNLASLPHISIAGACSTATHGSGEGNGNLDIQPTYTMRQYVYENLALDQVKEHFDEIQSSGYSVSLFTDWQKQRINELWIKRHEGLPIYDAALPSFPPRTAPSRWEWTDPGTSGCPTSASASLLAPGKSSSRNTCCLGAMPWTRFWQWSGCATR